MRVGVEPPGRELPNVPAVAVHHEHGGPEVRAADADERDAAVGQVARAVVLVNAVDAALRETAHVAAVQVGDLQQGRDLARHVEGTDDTGERHVVPVGCPARCDVVDTRVTAAGVDGALPTAIRVHQDDRADAAIFRVALEDDPAAAGRRHRVEVLLSFAPAAQHTQPAAVGVGRHDAGGGEGVVVEARPEDAAVGRAVVCAGGGGRGQQREHAESSDEGSVHAPNPSRR